MISIHENKEGTRTNELRQLLPQISIQTIGDYLSTKSTSQKEEEMRVETKKRKKFLENTEKYFGGKQNTLLQFGVLTHYWNRRIRLHYRDGLVTRRRINNVQIENYELDETKL